ncbi:MAG: outer membrane protein [Syntrophobacteraceae bacterium]
MKTTFVAVFMLSLLVIGGFAGAADPAGTDHNWTGFYVGLNAGAAINDSSYAFAPNPPPGDTGSGNFNNASFTAGGQAGYNYQINQFVIGLETDLNYNGIDQSGHINSPFTSTVTQKIDYFGTLRPRVGYLPTSKLLLYVTGGLAYGDVRSSSNILFTTPIFDNYIGSKSSMQVGWAAGGGIEYALSRNWSIKAEYLEVDLGSDSYSCSDGSPCGCSYRTDVKSLEGIARLGINYKF